MPQLRKKQRAPKASASPSSVAKMPVDEETDPKFSTINIDVRSCFVCRKDTSIFSENLFKINTKHSDTPVLKYIDKFLGYVLVKDESFEKLIICKCCLTKIDEFDRAYKTAKLVQNELKELLYVSVQTMKTNPNAFDVPNPIKYIVTTVDDDHEPTSAYMANAPTSIADELGNGEDVKLEIEILDSEENLDEAYSYEVDESNMECLDEYEIIEEAEHHLEMEEEEYFESHLSDTEEVSEEVPLKENDFDYGDCITMTCDLCNTSFKSLIEMDNHSKTVHGRLTKKSSKMVKIKDSTAAGAKEVRPFVDHMQMKVRKSEPTKKCKICLNKFYTVDDVKEHINTVHEFDDQRCDICGVLCCGKAKLQEHMDLHATRKPLECVICSKEVKRRSFLRQHMLIHTGEKVYQCDLCGKQFIHHSSMRMHMRMHRDVRDSECEICGHKSRSKSHLNKHMLTHTGEKKWQCSICLNRFASGGNMRAHMNIHLGIASRKKHTCMMCNQTFPSLSKLNAHQQLAHDSALQGGGDGGGCVVVVDGSSGEAV